MGINILYLLGLGLNQSYGVLLKIISGVGANLGGIKKTINFKEREQAHNLNIICNDSESCLKVLQ